MGQALMVYVVHEKEEEGGGVDGVWLMGLPVTEIWKHTGSGKRHE